MLPTSANRRTASHDSRSGSLSCRCSRATPSLRAHRSESQGSTSKEEQIESFERYYREYPMFAQIVA